MHIFHFVFFDVNGKPLQRLKAKRGLRQGDHMSSLLFVLRMKYLSWMMKCASCDLNFIYHSHCKSIKHTHLSFANDLMLFNDLYSI